MEKGHRLHHYLCTQQIQSQSSTSGGSASWTSLHSSQHIVTTESKSKRFVGTKTCPTTKLITKLYSGSLQNFSHMLLKMVFYVADTHKNMKAFKIISRNKGIHLTESNVNIEIWKRAEQNPLRPFEFFDPHRPVLLFPAVHTQI